MSALSRASSLGILSIFELLLGLREDEEEELGERRVGRLALEEEGEVLEVWGLVDKEEDAEMGGDKELGLLLVARLLLGGLIVLAVGGVDDLVSFLLLLVDS